ncbi:MAG: DUF885 domain-containing protein [Candidatus Bathyarchaeia archaeon]
MDDFFTSYYKYRPGNATFIGVHVYDHNLPDFSVENVKELCSEMETLLSRLRNEGHNNDLTSFEHLDCYLAANYLELQLSEFRTQRIHLTNPALYTGEATFGIISLFLRDFAPLADRAQAAVSRLEAIPKLLEEGKTNLKTAPTEWTKRAIQECEGASHLMQDGISILMQRGQLNSAKLRSAAETALFAFREFQEYLSDYLIPHGNSNYECGKSIYDDLNKKGHCLDLDSDQIGFFATEALKQRQERFRKEAFSFRKDGDWQRTLASLNDLHPSQPEYLQTLRQFWTDCVNTATKSNLLTWPDYTLQYTFIPDYFADAAPYLYFLPYRAPPAFEQITTYDYLVTPIPPTLPETEQKRRLRTMNFSVMKLNHVVHHGSVGHHLQNYHAYRAKSRIGQIGAIDCASRIAMFCSGTMAEGWACYSTDLMGEFGFYTPLEEFSEQHSSIRMAARAVVDAALHTDRMTIEEATQFYVTEAGMGMEAARSEVVKNSMFPATGAMYLLGTTAIHKLRKEMEKKMGSSFDLRGFHDQFLKHGSIPVSLIAQEMLGHSISLL